MNRFAVILPAGGSGTRFGGNKLLASVAGVPVIVRTILAFSGREDVSQVRVATSLGGETASAVKQAIASGELPAGRIHFCDGGACRAESVLNGARAIDDGTEWVAVHDAARPMASQLLIDRVFAAAVKHGAAAPAMPVALTIKEAAGPLPTRVERTLPRARLWAMQTPQCMRLADLLAAYKRCPIPMEQITDDLQLLELAGLSAMLVEGEEQNIKITLQSDLTRAEAEAIAARQGRP